MTDTILAFDYGKRRIGVAVGALRTQSSSPITTLVCGDNAVPWQEISELIDAWQPDRIIVGLPGNMDGTSSAMTKEVERFCSGLAQRFSHPVETVDERLSSVEALDELRELRAQGQKRKTIKREDVDKQAASVIARQWMREFGNARDE